VSNTSAAPAERSIARTEPMRERFYRVVMDILDEDPRAALVLAEIGYGYLDPAARRRLGARIVNVGIREQLMISVAGGMALAGMRPIAHTFPPFLLERAFEQVKLDLVHQDVGAVLVSAGGSYDWPGGGETHFGRRDVALLDTMESTDGWTVHVPGHPDEAEGLLRQAVAGDGRVYLRLAEAHNAEPRALPSSPGRMHVERTGAQGTVVAVGPMLDRVLGATSDLDVTVLYAPTVRPFDAQTLRATLHAADVVLVEPYLAGTSVRHASEALADVRHRLLGLGVGGPDLRRYGTAREHDVAHGLDEIGLRASITRFLRA
jgi:transketolase